MSSAIQAPRDAEAWLHLTLLHGVDAPRMIDWLVRLRTPQEVISAARRASPLLEPAWAARIAHGPEPRRLESALRWSAQPGCHLVTLADATYPAMLKHIADAPPVLFARGNLELLQRPAIAIVGSRNATAQGLADARGIAHALSDAGLCVVSGLAAGIDGAAHRGGLEGAFSSIAVLGTGIDRPYPSKHARLFDDLVTSGCVVTEFPLGTPPLAHNFPRRNRIISGLCRAVLVIEAALKSGSLITARSAGAQGRDVFALPGSVHSTLSKGCHELIREGAALVESAQDVLVELGMSNRIGVAPGAPREARDELLDLMGFAPISMEQLAVRSGMAASHIARRFSVLELEGRIEAMAGGLFQRIARRAS
jgi:DNA processing protein